MLSDEELLGRLEELRQALQASEVERYNYFILHSPEGRECKYAQRSLELFRLRRQREHLTALILSLAASLHEQHH